MVSFRPLSCSLPLASRAALFHSCAPSPVLRHAAAATRRGAPVLGKLGATAAGSGPGSAPSSFRALTTVREKVKVLLVLYDGGKHAEQVSDAPVSFFFFLHYTPNCAAKEWLVSTRQCANIISDKLAPTEQNRTSRDNYVKHFFVLSGRKLEAFSAFASDDHRRV